MNECIEIYFLPYAQEGWMAIIVQNIHTASSGQKVSVEYNDLI